MKRLLRRRRCGSQASEKEILGVAITPDSTLAVSCKPHTLNPQP